MNMSEYYLFPLQREVLLERLLYEKDLRRVFKKKKDLTKKVLEEINLRVNDEEEKNWVVLQINGETGSKKSSVALAMMKMFIDKNMTAEQVTQEYNEFIELLDKSEPKEGFILDELVFQRGMGSNRMKEELLNLVETLRKRQNSMIFVTPTEKFIQDANVTFTLEPCGFDKEEKVVRCLVRKNNRYIGFYYQKLLWNEPLWIEYEKGKDEFLERTKSQKYKKLDYEKLALEIISESTDEELKNGKRITLIIEKKGKNLTIQERDLLVEQIKMLKN